ncbi:unnamed protein product [Rotaria sp. Silwood2]|nr:unnamed protein product [Rotaria sp. Silwood2]CAF4080797.1 unnamed protein product [Rotaria sp. Silwood2]
MRVQPREFYDSNIHSAINMALRNRSLHLLGDNGFYSIGFHGPILLYREIGIKIWDEFQQEMHSLISHPFRMRTDPSIQTLYIYIGYSNYYTFLKARNILKFEMLTNRNPQIIQRTLNNAFLDKSSYFVCINDDLPLLTEEIEKCLNEAYEKIFPKRCSFEY